MRIDHFKSPTTAAQFGLLGLVCLVLGQSIALAAGVDDSSSQDRPNLILIMADDLGWGDPSYQGHSNIATPGLDRMAKDGMRFNRFYAAAPVCSPTRASCLTGRHPFRQSIFGANSGHLLERERNLAEVLKTAGYRTGHFGKWHLGTLTVEMKDSNRGGPNNKQHYAPPWDRGFDATFSTEAKVPTWDPLLVRPDVNRRTFWEPLGEGEEGESYGTAYWSHGERVDEPLRGDDSQLIVDRALTFMDESIENEDPFFAVIWFHSPHLPVVAGPEWAKAYADEEDYARHYKGTVAALDAQVERVRSFLEEHALDDSTLVCFCSDNGPEGNSSAPGSAGDLRGRKRSLYEGGVRVPGLMVWPGRIKAGSSTDLPAVTSDYFLTLLDVAGVQVPDDRAIDGISLASWFDDVPEKRGSPICFESGNQLSIVDDQYKLILKPANSRSSGGRLNPNGRTPPIDDFDLFDLAEDPSEQSSVAADHPEIVRSLHEQLGQWRTSVQASREQEPGEPAK